MIQKIKNNIYSIKKLIRINIKTQTYDHTHPDIKIGEITSIQLDRHSRRIYWVDESMKYIVSSGYNGKNLFVHVHTDLHIPRSLLVNPVDGSDTF